MEIHQIVTCDECRGYAVGDYYQCTVCTDYHLCVDCKNEGCHQQHSQRKVHPPSRSERGSLNFLYVEVTCDGCKCRVRKIYYKCNDCSNYALCSQCKERIHHAHSMTEMPLPNNQGAVSHVKVAGASTNQPTGYLHENVSCDGCSGSVRGIRYMCTVCPDYDLCSGCKQRGIHSEHRMKEIHEPSSSPQQSSASDSDDEDADLAKELMLVGLGVLLATANSDTETDDPFTERWGPEEPGEPFLRKQLHRSEQEYKDVIANMIAAGGLQWKHKVKQICRIENYRMYNIYKACKDEMEKHNEPGFQNESVLWHGTSADVLNNIYRDGFNRSYCGRNATAYGNGVYFATMFEYSAAPKFSPPDSKGQKYIFQCRVLTGHFAAGSQGLKEPPMRTRELRYDSVVNKVTDPTTFVIFKDMQVYPEYVITFTV